ncbi:MAG: acyl-CoA carboxylase subunit beta, partial [Bacteroidales bacterium]|nr:acyl-CoA carboxylase subunit beta [Bacteroidales bacterium]
MYKIETKISTKSEDFKKNKEEFQKLVNELHIRIKDVKNGRDKKAITKHKERGKLLVRERINLLIDKNTPFLELSTLAAYGIKENSFPAAGIITGIGTVHGRETMIIANDATVKGGTYMQQTIKKHVRAQQIALENMLPTVYMVDSGGAFL